MKISKIFHSLYAFLMFLPVCAVLGTTLYTILNPNAKDSYSGSVTHEEYQQVVSYLPSAKDENNNLIQDNYYRVSQFYIDSQDYLFDSDLYLNFTFYPYSGEFELSTLSFSVDESVMDDTFFESGEYTTFRLSVGGGFMDLTLQVGYNHYYSNYTTYVYSIDGITPDDFIIKFDYIEECYFDGDNLDFELIHNYTNLFDYFETVSIPQYSYELVEVEETTLDNAFSYSVNALYLNPLFSWCNSSFLTEPFHYIGDLFGLPRDNAINTLFSYWLNISIIWLCFDVIMYVPLLCHRWIDKGGLE